jgi:hypothetical protein
MGRGRAKAKQTKVARELKYRQQGPDFTQLQRELHGGDEMTDDGAPAAEEDDGEDDLYARYIDPDDAEPAAR